MTMQTKKFYEYDDYRLLLDAKFKYLKSTRKKMSLQLIADAIGISRSFLTMLLSRERHVSIDKLGTIANTFKMDRDEKNYFIFLACKNLVNDPAMAEYFSNHIRTLQAQGGADFATFEEEMVNQVLFKDSLPMIIRSLQRFGNFQEDAAWIQKQLSGKLPSTEEIETVLKETAEVRASKEFIQGKVGPGENPFSTAQVGLKLASQALKTPADYRPLQFNMCSLAFDEANEKEAFRLFVELSERLKELAARSIDPTSVLFVSNTMVCVANKKD